MPDPSPTDTATSTRASLARCILDRAVDGVPYQPPEIADLMLFRVDQPYMNICAVYEPCVALIVQGSKRILLGDDTLHYGENRYLITSMDLPVQSAVLEASPERPYLGVGLRLDWREIASLMLETPTPPPGSTVRDSRAMTTGALNAPLLEAFDRLLALLDQPEHVAALAPLIKREIHYRLMVGEAGARLRQIATVDTQSHQVARAIASLNARFAEPLRVETLARESGMSLSTFHHHFKALTAMSPLQYQKQRRLTESRRLMMSEGMDASTAAFRVGYESPSQFSREYRRLFGAPPSKDMADLRRQPEQAAA
ncbi:MAG: AraC family transcriptional regulator [Betaproteobacteria bacterium HGW-Betaproteobacteria-9]|jgi:AraC-like DNA-binding protein|nr:MAG: AraC family transcriptional regulator [Betaproteobacteria bacterium HGW-Betaproteobacteria-9]